MKEFQVTVVEDRIEDRQKTCAILEKEGQALGIPMKIFQATDSDDFFCDWEEKRCDLYILDIHLGEKSKRNGFQVAEAIREKDALASIVFLTRDGSYVVKAYDVEAYHYLLKPDGWEELGEVFRKLYGRWKKNRERIRIKTFRGDWETVVREDIYYIQVEGRQCKIHRKGGELCVYRGLQSIKEELGEDFCYVRKDCLVNIRNIRGRQNNRLRMANGEEIEISRKYGKDPHFE